MRKKWTALIAYSIMACMMIISMIPTTVSAATYTNTKTCGSVKYSISCNSSSYYYSKGDRCTKATTTINWNWNSCPIDFGYTDIVAVGNGQGFTVKQLYKCKRNLCTPSNVASCKVTYYLAPHQSASSSKKYGPKTVNLTVRINGSGKGAYVNVPMKKLYKINGMNCIYYAKVGKLTINWEKQGKVSLATFAANYGHTKTSAKPSVAISGYDLKFQKKMVKGSNAYISLKKKL